LLENEYFLTITSTDSIYRDKRIERSTLNISNDYKC
jgi:hypothetical protein